jgi:RNA polymerase sigma factor (sigma-70 family)
MESLDYFLEQIGRHPLLTPEEEIQLGRQVQAWVELRDRSRLGTRQQAAVRAGKRAYDRMFLANMRLVVFAAKKFIRVSRTLTMDDLVQEGFFGLARSIEKFDPERGYKFSTYSYWWIRQSIMRALEIQDRIIRLPVTGVQMLTKLKKWIRQFELDHGRLPTEAECVDYCGARPDFLRAYLLHAPGCGSLDANATTESSSDPLVTLLPSDSQNTIDLVIEQDEHSRLQQALRTLEPEELALLETYYGLHDTPTKSRTQMGKEMHVTHETVRLRELNILNKLRTEMELVDSVA